MPTRHEAAVGMYDDVYEDDPSEQRTEVKPMEPPRPVRPGPPTETRPFALASEFAAVVLLLVGLAVAAATTDDVDATTFWMLATLAVGGYVFARGLAKSQTGSRAADPREALLERIGRRRRTR